MDKVRVLVANRPRLMRELILATIADQPDIEVMAEIEEDCEIMRVVRESQPHFVIIALDTSGQRPLICDELLEQYPRMKILAVAPDRNDSMFFWSVVEIRSAAIENSEEGILAALRSSARAVA